MSAQTRSATPQNKTGVKPAATAPAPKPATEATPAPQAASGAPATAGAAQPAEAAKPTDPNAVVMTIGTEKVTAHEFETFVQGLPEQYRSAAQGPMKRNIAEQYAQVRLMALEAKKRGLDKDPVVQSQVQFQSDNLLAGALFKQMQANVKPDEAALRKAYDENKSQYEQIHARHILIKFKGSPVPTKEGKPELTEEQALAKATELRKRITGGEDFAKIAKEESDDTGSGANGGDLGDFHRGQMVPEFEKTAFALPVGQVSEPVKTQFGYHIIQVEKHEAKSFDDVRADLEKSYKPQAAKEEAEKLKTTVGMKLDDSYFGAAQPAVSTGVVNANPVPASH